LSDDCPEFGAIDHDAVCDRLILAGAEDRLTSRVAAPEGVGGGWVLD
jgi:hypothetical protein